jgi:hypothetical protein
VLTNEAPIFDAVTQESVLIPFLGLLELSFDRQPRTFRQVLQNTAHLHFPSVVDKHLHEMLRENFVLTFLRGAYNQGVVTKTCHWHHSKCRYGVAQELRRVCNGCAQQRGVHEFGKYPSFGDWVADVIIGQPVSVLCLQTLSARTSITAPPCSLEQLGSSHSNSGLDLCSDGSTSKREIATLALLEYCNMARIVSAQLRTSFIRALIDAPVCIFKALEPLLCDRLAPQREVLGALEILSLVCQAEVGAFRDFCVRCKRLPTLKNSKEITLCINVSAGDDGRSIRLLERLELQGVFDDRCITEEMLRYCAARLPHGEHGLLVDSIDRFSPVIHALVWRLVDDPDIGVQQLCAELLRNLLNTDTASNEDKEPFLTLWYDHYMPMLLSPFVHPGLPEVENRDPSEAMIRLASATAAFTACGAPQRPGVHLMVSHADIPPVLEMLGNGFKRGDQTFGQESACSKHSKLLVLDLLLQCIELHGYRTKYYLLRTNAINKVR